MIAVEDRVPWLTSPVLGMTLGVIIATLLLPAAFIYLRSNVTRRQPWQLEDVSPASRIAIAYGRWLADIAVLAAVLAATTAAACLLALLLLPLNEVEPASIILMLLLVFAATAHAGRSEQKGLLSLTATAALSPTTRRIAFVLAGTALALVMAVLSGMMELIAGETRILLEAAAVGAVTSVTAITSTP